MTFTLKEKEALTKAVHKYDAELEEKWKDGDLEQRHPHQKLLDSALKKIWE